MAEGEGESDYVPIDDVAARTDQFRKLLVALQHNVKDKRLRDLGISHLERLTASLPPARTAELTAFDGGKKK